MSLELELARYRTMIAEDTARVVKQVALVARLKSIGCDAQLSETLLRNYQAAKALHQVEMDLCQQEGSAKQQLP